MARNAVQFQKGLSFSEFTALYGHEEQCHAALIEMRWPEGFVCPRCGGRRHSYATARRIFQCSTCRTQTSVKAGTIFHKGLSVNNGSDWCWLSRRARADRVVPVAVEIVAAEVHLC